MPLAWITNWRSDSPARAAAESLNTVRRDLEGFTGATEDAFLSVCQRLMDLQSRTREIASQTAAIATLLSNDEASLVLEQVLNTADDGREGEKAVEAVNAIYGNAREISRAIDAVSPLVRTFDVLGIMTRIESSRFEAAGMTFTGLAESVTALSRQIREQMSTTAGSATVLGETIGAAAEQIREVARSRRQILGPLARQIGAGLVKIRDHRARISHAGNLLAARFQGISEAVGDLVTALQAHDIVRQQIEHIVQALENARSSGIIRLQAAQLDHSRRTFENSLQQIRNSLARIEREIAEVAEESASLLGRSGTADESYLSGVESDLAGILGILEAGRRADRLLREAAVSIRERVSGMAQTISGVHIVGLEMQRLALNATIHAVRLGEDGGALEIVAYATRNLAQNAGSAASTIENLLTAMNEGVSGLEISTEASDGSEAQIAQLRHGLDGLRSVQDEARGANDRTSELIAGLNQRIHEAIGAFGAPEEFLDVLAAAGKALHDLSADAGAVDSAAMDEIASTYTMDSERAVHKALYEAVPAAEEATAAQDDSVEFF